MCFFHNKYNLFFLILNKSALSVCAHQALPFLHHISAALWAYLLRGLLPGHKIAVWIVLTSIVFPALFGLLHDDFFAAFGTGHADFLQIRLGIAAVWETRAGQEPAVRPVFNYHIPST